MRYTVRQDNPASAVPPARCSALLVADPLVRIALRQLLQAAGEVEVVGESTVDQAADQARRLAPDIALVDGQRLQDGRLADFLADLQAASPRTRTIVLWEDDLDHGLVGAVRAGAWGYLSRDVTPHQLARAVRLVTGGRVVMECALTREQFQRLGGLDDGAPGGGALTLTPKETKVIQAMAEGHTDEQIARHLGVSVPTVKTHVRSILRKTSARNRAAAIAAAFRSGVLR
jgi:DNA-binding NarL/FixJ family response regulator